MRAFCGSQMLLRIVAVMICLLLLACGGGGVQLNSLPQASGDHASPATEIPVTDQPVLVNETDPGAETLPANKLVLSAPDISQLSVGDEFSVSLAGAFSDEVYQGSMRLLFDPAYFKPVSANPGSMLLSDMVRLTGLDQSGFVPFAFTGLPGHNAIPAGTGELLRVRFRILQAGAAQHRIALQNDTEFLQLRDRQSRRLPFDLESSAGVQQ